MRSRCAGVRSSSRFILSIRPLPGTLKYRYLYASVLSAKPIRRQETATTRTNQIFDLAGKVALGQRHLWRQWIACGFGSHARFGRGQSRVYRVARPSRRKICRAGGKHKERRSGRHRDPSSPRRDLARHRRKAARPVGQREFAAGRPRRGNRVPFHLTVQNRGRQCEQTKSMVALLALLQVRQQSCAPLRAQGLAPQRGKFLSCFKTIHDPYLLRPIASIRSACLRSACRARNARIFTLASLHPSVSAISLTLNSSLSFNTITIRSSGFSVSSRR